VQVSISLRFRGRSPPGCSFPILGRIPVLPVFRRVLLLSRSSVRARFFPDFSLATTPPPSIFFEPIFPPVLCSLLPVSPAGWVPTPSFRRLEEGFWSPFPHGGLISLPPPSPQMGFPHPLHLVSTCSSICFSSTPPFTRVSPALFSPVRYPSPFQHLAHHVGPISPGAVLPPIQFRASRCAPPPSAENLPRVPYLKLARAVAIWLSSPSVYNRGLVVFPSTVKAFFPGPSEFFGGFPICSPDSLSSCPLVSCTFCRFPCLFDAGPPFLWNLPGTLARKVALRTLKWFFPPGGLSPTCRSSFSPEAFFSFYGSPCSLLPSWPLFFPA